MTEKAGGIEYYIDADANAVITAGKKVYESTSAMQQDFNKVDNAVKKVINSQIQMGRTIDSTGKVMSKSGKEIVGATKALQALIAKQKELTATSTKVNDAYQKLNASNKVSQEGFRGLGRGAGQASIQLQQFVGQVQGGQNAMLALSQQAADLGIVLGVPLAGTVVALGAAFLSYLIPSLGKSSDETQELIDKLKELKETQLLTAEQSEFLISQSNKTVKEKQKEIEEINKQINANKFLINSNANVASSMNGITGGATQQVRLTAEEVQELKDENLELAVSASILAADVKATNEQIEAYKLSLKGANNQTGEQKKAVDELVNSLKEQLTITGKDDRQLLESMLTRSKATDAQRKQALYIYDLIKAKESQIEKEKEDQKLSEQKIKTYESVLVAYQRQAAQLELNSQQMDEYNARQRLGLSDTEALPDAIQAEIDKLEELRQKKAEITEQDRAAREIEQKFKVISDELNQQDDPLAALEEKLAAERDIIKAHYAAKLEDEKLSDEQQMALREQQENYITALEEKAAQDRKAILDREQAAKLQAISGAFNNLSSLMNTESKKLFEIGKAAAIAGALVDAYAAVAGAYKVGAKIGGPPIGAAFAAAAGIAQAVNIQKIAKQKIGGAQSMGATASYSGGLPVTNTQQQGQGFGDRNVTIAGLDRNSIFSGEQVINLLKEVVGDGADVTFLTGGG